MQIIDEITMDVSGVLTISTMVLRIMDMVVEISVVIIVMAMPTVVVLAVLTARVVLFISLWLLCYNIS